MHVSTETSHVEKHSLPNPILLPRKKCLFRIGATVAKKKSTIFPSTLGKRPIASSEFSVRKERKYSKPAKSDSFAALTQQIFKAFCLKANTTFPITQSDFFF